MKIKPTTWNMWKSEGIDFSKKFLWLDDSPSDFDRAVLLKNNCLQSLVVVTLEDEDYNLLDVV